MREILQLGVGQFGVATSYSFWSQLAQENSISPDGNLLNKNPNHRLGVFWDETSENQYHPRTMQLDLDPQGIDNILGLEYSSLLSPDNLLHGSQSSNNNWAIAHYNTAYLQGFELTDIAFDQIRKIIEKCDNFQGCYLNLGLSGGAGSGLGSLLVQKLKDYDKKKQIHCFCLFPNYNFENNVLAPYNSTLSINYMNEHTDLVYVFDNEQLFKIVDRDMILAKPTFGDTNNLVIFVLNMTTFSSSIRYPNLVNADLRKQTENLVPFPNLHYLPTSLVQIKDRSKMTTTEAINELHKKENLQAELDLSTESSMLTTYIAACGYDLSSGAIENSLYQLINSKEKYYVDWILSNFLMTLSKVNPLGEGHTIGAAFNNINFKHYLELTSQRFNKQFQRKAYLHFYTMEGMDEMEFTEADSYMTDLIDNYSGHHGEVGSDEDEDEDVDENMSIESEDEF